MTDTENVTTTTDEDEQEVFYCSQETYRASQYQPAEYCENEVDNEGDLCGSCGRYEEGPDPDDARDEWLDRQAEDRWEQDYWND